MWLRFSMSKHLDRQALERGLAKLPLPPQDQAHVERLIIREPAEQRRTPARLSLSREGGVQGDRWAHGASPNVAAQVTLMRADVAALFANGQPWEILGDNLMATLDTSAENLPPGTLLRVGSARCVVTPKPHTGCNKFAVRVGEAAWHITFDPAWKMFQLRGVHLQVLEDGEIALGEVIMVESRPGR